MRQWSRKKDSKESPILLVSEVDTELFITAKFHINMFLPLEICTLVEQRAVKYLLWIVNGEKSVDICTQRINSYEKLIFVQFIAIISNKL